MDIKEAIRHCYEAAERMYKEDPCSVCAAEHEQLAHWLEELQAYRALGPIDKLSALVKAKDEGRAVVLPEDGMLYHFEEIPETGERWVGNKPIQKIIFSCGFGLVGIPFDFSQLGKTVFLTRAEAEAALGGGGDEV